MTVVSYDPESDILYIKLEGGAAVRTLEHDWGLVELASDDRPVAIEYWNASRQLPADFLGALPDPRIANPMVPSLVPPGGGEGCRHRRRGWAGRSILPDERPAIG